MIERFNLPKRTARSLENPIGFSRCVPLPALEDLAKGPVSQRAQNRMHVIRHQTPNMILETHTGVKLKRRRHDLGNLRSPQPALAIPCIKILVQAT
jgi:hypothetical protein